MALTIKEFAVQATAPKLLVTVQLEMDGPPAGESYAGLGAAIRDYLVAARRARAVDAVAVVRALPNGEKTQAVAEIQAP